MTHFDDLPQNKESILKEFLAYSIDHHIKSNQLDTKTKDELLILKKYFLTQTMKDIFNNVNFHFIKKNSQLELHFSDEIKQYVDDTYNRYIKKNKSIC